MACNNCKDNNQIPQHSKEELAFAFLERMVKRLWIALIVVIAMLFASNAAWLIYESQFATISYEQDGEGINNVNIGEQGDLINGTESEDPG